MKRVPRALKVTSLMLAALMAGMAGGRTTAEFSATTANSANSFSAATSFGGAARGDAVVVKSGASSTSYAAGVLSDAPIAYWRFGEPVGSATAVDASGNGRNGVVPTIDPKPALGYDWSGLLGDGDTAYVWNSGAAVTVPHADPLRLNGSFSAELWMKGSADLWTPGEQVVLDKGGNPDANGWQITYDSTGVFRFRRNNVAVSSVTPILPSDSFLVRHIVFTFDGTMARWYVDGVLQASSATTFPTSSGTGNLAFVSNWTTTIQTTLDEPALYGTALSATRVNAHYRAGKMLSPDVCEAYRVYANVTDGGSPVTGVTSVTADLSSVTPGGTAVPLAAGSYTVGGVNYAYRSAPLRTGVVEGSYGYSVTWVDAGGAHTQAGLATTVGTPIPIAVQWLAGMETGTSQNPDLFKEVSGTMRSTSAHSGQYSRRVVKDVNNHYVGKDGFTATTALSLALRLDPLPTADVTSLVTFNTSATPLYVGYQASSQKLTLRWGANTAAVAASAVVAGTWYTVDLRVDVSANPNTAAWRIDGVDQAAVSLAAAAQTVTTVRFGSTVATDAFTAEYDDVVHSRSLLDYPIGPVRILPSRPDGMGSSVGVSNFDHEDGSPISSSSFERLDDPVMTSTADSVRQVTASATSYLEFTMGNTTEVCVRGVQATAYLSKPASQANNLKVSVFLGSTERVVASGDVGTTLAYKTITVAPVDTWSPAAFNGLLFRAGYSSDIAPTPNVQSLLLEYVTSG